MLFACLAHEVAYLLSRSPLCVVMHFLPTITLLSRFLTKVLCFGFGWLIAYSSVFNPFFLKIGFVSLKYYFMLYFFFVFFYHGKYYCLLIEKPFVVKEI